MGPILDKPTGQDRGQESDEKEEEHGGELAENDSDVLLLVPSLLLTPLLLLGSHATTSRLMPKEHEVEEFFRRHKLLIVKVEVAAAEARMATSAAPTCVLSFLEGSCTSQLIVLPALVRVVQCAHGLIDSLESVVGLRRVVLIRMNLQTLLMICFLEFLVSGVSRHAQHLIVVLAGEDFSRHFLFFGRKLFRLGSDFGTFGGRRAWGPLSRCSLSLGICCSDLIKSLE